MGTGNRRIILLILAAVLLLAPCGCMGSEDSKGPDEILENGEAPDQTPVTLHVYNTLSETADMKEIESYIRRTMPNVTVESMYEIGPKMESAQLAAVRGGGGPEILYTQDYYTYVQNGYLKDLTAEPYLKNYMISALHDTEVGGKVYALPVGNGYISGLMVNMRLLKELGYELPETQEEFIRLCRQIQSAGEDTGVRAYACSMLYNDSSAVVAMPFLLDAYTDSGYVQWLTQYRNNPEEITFDDPAFVRVLDGIEELRELDLTQSGDFLTNDTQNLQEVLRGDAVMCSVNYVTYMAHFEERIRDVDGVPMVKVSKNDVGWDEPAENFVFLPYRGKTAEDRWLTTNGDWYLGINTNVTDEATLKACRLYLEYVASTKFAPEYYSASVPVGATTYYRRDDILEYDFFRKNHPEVYECLTENSVVKNPYQFYGSDLFTFAQRYYLCGQKYYAGLEGDSTYMPIDGAADILDALEEYRTAGRNRYQVSDRVIGHTRKAYGYVRIYSRANESALSNLLADAIREYTGADLAVINAGALTAGIEEGEITESGLATAMLYGLSNHLVTVRCRGENLLSILSTNNMLGFVCNDTSGVFGGLVIPSGFTYSVTYEPAEDGMRAKVGDVCLSDGTPVDPEAYYTVTTTDYELGGSDLWHAFCLLPQEKPEELPEGIALYQTFKADRADSGTLFELDVENYEKQYEQIMEWAHEQPNIIDAVIRYMEEHSESGELTPVSIDGRIRIIDGPQRLNPAANGVDLG